ncbi:MAG: hAT transposon family protein [Sphingosinicella sp.]|nr:hAT transposon family protein [Sphingosinicella sp.]
MFPFKNDDSNTITRILQPLEKLDSLITLAQGDASNLAVLYSDVSSLNLKFSKVVQVHAPDAVSMHRCQRDEYALLCALIDQLNRYFFSRTSWFASKQKNLLYWPPGIASACSIIALASRLDPRMVCTGSWASLVAEFIRTEMISTVLSPEEYIKQLLIECIRVQLHPVDPAQQQPAIIEEEVLDSELPDYSNCFLSERALKVTSERTCDTATDEVTRFMSIPIDWKWAVDDKNRLTRTPRDFWTAKRTEYPHIADIAEQIFIVSSSAAEVERLFSVCGDLCTDKTSKMSADVISQRIFCSRNMYLLSNTK